MSWIVLKNASDQDGASEYNTDAPISDAAKSPIIPLTVIVEVASSLENFSSLEDLASAALASPSMCNSFSFYFKFLSHGFLTCSCRVFLYLFLTIFLFAMFFVFLQMYPQRRKLWTPSTMFYLSWVCQKILLRPSRGLHQSKVVIPFRSLCALFRCQRRSRSLLMALDLSHNPRMCPFIFF